jgi:hypothetical protein
MHFGPSDEVSEIRRQTKHYYIRTVVSSNVTRAVESELEGVLGAVGVGKNVPTPTPTSV